MIGCLRKFQHWSHTSIFDEYRTFSYPKSRAMDQQFIELFDVRRVVYVAGYLPDWPELNLPRPRTLPGPTPATPAPTSPSPVSDSGSGTSAGGRDATGADDGGSATPGDDATKSPVASVSTSASASAVASASTSPSLARRFSASPGPLAVKGSGSDGSR